MRPRVINYLRHNLSARQALAMAIEMWSESRHLAVLLVTPVGQAEVVAKTIRVAFAKEKKRTDQQVHYGFTLSDPFPYTDGGVTGEAIVLDWRMTPRQRIANQDLFSDLKGFINGQR